jgi:hypothetical protein
MKKLLDPIEKRRLVDAVAYGGTATIGFFIGAPFSMILGVLGLAVVWAFTGAVWEGARPQVVAFSADTTAWVLDAIRARYGIGRRHERLPPSGEAQ